MTEKAKEVPYRLTGRPSKRRGTACFEKGKEKLL